MIEGAQAKTENTGARYRLVEAPGAWPLLGHTVQVLRDPVRFIRSLPEHGDLVKVKIGAMDAIVVCNPDLTVEMLRNDTAFIKGGEISRQQRRAAGLPFTQRQKASHRHQRRTMAPLFHIALLPEYAALLCDELDRVLGSWRDGQLIDARDEMSRIAAGWAFKSLFGREIPDSVKLQLAHDVHTVFYSMPRHAIMPAAFTKLPIPFNRRYERARRRVWEVTHRLIADQKAGIGNDQNLVAALVRASENDDLTPESPGRMTDEEVGSNVIAFVYTSFDTTSATLSWALHALAQNPQLQERLHREIRDVVGDASPTADVLPKLGLVNNVLKETLRLYSPTLTFSRSTDMEVDLGGHKIPAGTTILWSAHMVHHRGDIYRDPERFDPDRWADLANTARPSAGTYLPFATGPRKCIAENFAFTGTALALSVIASRWRLEPVPGPTVRPDMALVFSPRNLRLRVTAWPASRTAVRPPA